jgi:hypothetical protein
MNEILVELIPAAIGSIAVGAIMIVQNHKLKNSICEYCKEKMKDCGCKHDLKNDLVYTENGRVFNACLSPEIRFLPENIQTRS